MLFIWWLESLHFYVLTLPTSRRKNIIQRQDKYLHLLLWGMLALTPSQQSTSVNYLDSQCSKLASPGLAGYIREVPNPASTHSIKWKDKCAFGGTGQGKEAWLKLTQSLSLDPFTNISPPYFRQLPPGPTSTVVWRNICNTWTVGDTVKPRKNWRK